MGRKMRGTSVRLKRGVALMLLWVAGVSPFSVYGADDDVQRIEAGRRIATFCANCHGASGVSAIPNVPNLAAQNPDYLLAQIDAFVTGKRKMLVGRFRPADFPRLHRVLVTSPQPIDDLALRPIRGDDTQWLAVIAENRDLLVAKTIIGQRPQGGHQVDKRIAVLVELDRIGDHDL